MTRTTATKVLGSIAVLALLTVGCASTGGHRISSIGKAAFDDASWDDGMAVVSVFRGQFKRYGEWREAEVRDYVVREYLDPQDWTKRNGSDPDLVPVIKVNRMVQFPAGSYDYRLMSSLFFRRDDSRLVKGVGVCLNACGVVYQRWDRSSQRLVADSYWEHEGRTDSSWPAEVGSRFADELPFVAATLDSHRPVHVWSPLAYPRSIAPREEGEAARTAAATSAVDLASLTSLGIGDSCDDCVITPSSGPSADPMSPVELPQPLPPTSENGPLRIERDGNATRLISDDGTLRAEFRYDANGFLSGWTIPGEQEFHRTSVFRGPYWERTAPTDHALLEGR